MALKRSGMNVNLIGQVWELIFIDQVKQSQNFGPVGVNFATGSSYTANLDAGGWPAHADYDNKTWSVAIRLPHSQDFAGPYVMTWEGSGEVQFTSGTWTIDAGASSSYTAVNASRWHGANSRIVLNYTGERLNPTIQVIRTNRDGVNGFIKNIKFYRLEDEADLLAGKVYRAPWKQMMADLNPGYIRFMNWTGFNGTLQGDFRYRTLPTHGVWNSGRQNWIASPPYGDTSGTNEYTLAAVGATPASPRHGEVVTCRMTNSAVSGSKTITGISQAANGRVTTSAAHTYITGEKVLHEIAGGMIEMHLKVCTVTDVDSTHYDLNIDTSGFTAYTFGADSSESTLRRSSRYMSLNLGTWGAYPVITPEGISIGRSGTHITANDYKTFVFDKQLKPNRDVSGTWIEQTRSDAFMGYDGGAPLEVCTKMINELMEMTRSDGGAVGPIDMWITVPHLAITSVDPDYVAAANWPVNAVDVILNGATHGAVTWPGLHASSNLIVEFTNESWNNGLGFGQSPILALKGVVKYGGAASINDYFTVKAMVVAREISTAYPGNTRIKNIICGQGTGGITGTNGTRLFGSANTDGDAWNTWGGDPIDSFDAWGWAGYFEPLFSWQTANEAAYAAAYIAAMPDDAAMEAAIDDFIQDALVVPSGGGFESTSYYGQTRLPEYNTMIAAEGKETYMYEGGWNPQCALVALRTCTSATSGNPTVTIPINVSGVILTTGLWVVGVGIPEFTKIASVGGTTIDLDKNPTESGRIVLEFYNDVNYFMRATKKSRSWAKALRNYFDIFDGLANSKHPADYIVLSERFGSWPFDQYVNGVEGAIHSEAWRYTSLRNRNKRRKRLTASA